MAEGVTPGRASAGMAGPVWHSLGKRALEMVQPEVSKDGARQKPEWEDVEAHSECVGMIMGLRCGDVSR